MPMSERGDSMPAQADETRILFVSHLPEREGGVLAGKLGQDIRVVDFRVLDEALFVEFAPHFVISPMVAPTFDMLDLAQKLWQMRFRGAYRVLTEETLPNPGVVLREIHLHCPGLDVDILSMDTLRG
jgi:hypothetical protein